MIKILLVEDNEIVRASLIMLLEDNFSIVGEAADGLTAIEMLREGLVVDIVLTDLNMPKLDGISLTEMITKMNTDAKVIILTMHDRKTYLTRALEAGAKGYLLKSGDIEVLSEAIHKVHKGEQVIGLDIRTRDNH